jgi:hypothetical protein
MKFLAKLEAMSEEDVLDLVPPRIMASIKRDDKRPIFKAFVIGQEGEAKPRIVGIGQKLQHWFTSAIQALEDKLKIGESVFNLHAKTNAHEGRKPIGEVVGKALRKVKDKLSAIAVTYIYPPYQDLKLDVASVEANVLIPEEAPDHQVEDVDVLDVTGIALGNSDINKPAFPGATLLAQLQAFAEKTPQKGDNKMTLAEIQQAIQESKFRPEDVFGPKVLQNDPFIQELVKEEAEKESRRKGYETRKSGEIEKELEKVKKDLETAQAEAKNLKGTALKVKAEAVLETVLKARPKLVADEKFTKYVRKAYGKDFQPGEETTLQKDIEKFLDAQVDDYKEVFGEPGKEGDDRSKGGGVGASDSSGGKSDMSDPKNNPHIPKEE